MTMTIEQARQYIEGLSDEDVLREFQKNWTDMQQVARALRTIMIDALSGDSATKAIDDIAKTCGVPYWKHVGEVTQAVVAMHRRVDALVVQIETTPVLTGADRQALAAYNTMEDRTRKFDAVEAERNELATKFEAREQALRKILATAGIEGDIIAGVQHLVAHRSQLETEDALAVAQARVAELEQECRTGKTVRPSDPATASAVTTHESATPGAPSACEGSATDASVSAVADELPHPSDGSTLAASSAPNSAATSSDRSVPRQLFLAWNGTEWADTRCGCRYHPDDDNGSHGGGPHVHPCQRHRSRSADPERFLPASMRTIGGPPRELPTPRGREELLRSLETAADRCEWHHGGLGELCASCGETIDGMSKDARRKQREWIVDSVLDQSGSAREPEKNRLAYQPEGKGPRIGDG